MGRHSSLGITTAVAVPGQENCALKLQFEADGFHYKFTFIPIKWHNFIRGRKAKALLLPATSSP